MPNKSRITLLIIACALMLGLALSQAQETTPTFRGYGVQLYSGDGWSFLYPLNATVETISETELQVVGPEIAIRPADADFTVSGPAYQMSVMIYDNPERVFPEVWAEQQILADWQAAGAGSGPNPYPVTSDGQLDPEKFAAIIVANLPAAKAEFFGGDAAVFNIYFSTGDKIVVFSYRAEPELNNPIALMQLDIYMLMINSFTVTAEE